MSPPLDQFREPPTLTTHVAPGSLLPRAVPNRTRHQAGPACLTASNSAQRAEDTAPPICKEQQSAHPHCPGYDSRRPAKLLNSEPSGRHSLADRASRQTSFWYQPVTWTEDQKSTARSFLDIRALDQALPLQGLRGDPNTSSKSTNSVSTEQGGAALAAISSSNELHQNSCDSPQRLSVFSFFSQCNQSVAASLIRLEKTILKYEGVIFEILNARSLVNLTRDASSRDTPATVLPTVQLAGDRDLSVPVKMLNPFRSSKGKIIQKESISNSVCSSSSKMTPAESKHTPPRAIFSDYPAAHSAITNVPPAKLAKIPSPTPGLPIIDDPYMNLPPTIDLPETPAKNSGGPASQSLKARIASREYLATDILERPETPLLPPAPVPSRPERRAGSSDGVGPLFREPFASESQFIDKNSFELAVIKRDTRNDHSHAGSQVKENETSKFISRFEPETPSSSSVYRATERDPSSHHGLKPDVHQSSTVDSIIGRCDEDRRFLRMREGSRRSIEISNSSKVSSLSADDDDDGEVGFPDSTAGHTPPLTNLMLVRKAPQRSTSGYPPQDPLPDIPARQAFRDALDMAGSDPTSYGHTKELLNMTSELGKTDPLEVVGLAGDSCRRGLVFHPHVEMAAEDRHVLVQQGSIPLDHGIADNEPEIPGRCATPGCSNVGSECEIRIDNQQQGAVDGLLRPLEHLLNSDNHHLATLGRGRIPHSAACVEERDKGGLSLRLCRRPDLNLGPSMTQLGPHIHPERQKLRGNSLVSQGMAASSRFQHDETLASLTGEVPHRSRANTESLCKDVGGTFGAVEGYNGGVFDKDKDQEEGDDGDWETLHESELKIQIPPKPNTNQGDTAISLAEMSSYGYFTASGPATPWDSLTGGARVLTQPPVAALRNQGSVETGREKCPAVMLPEYSGSGWQHAWEGLEMTTRVRPRVLERPFPAFATTSQPPNTSQSRFHATYRHPEPMSEEHKHPFSLTPPPMAPTHGLREITPTTLGIVSDEIQYLRLAERVEDGAGGTTPTGVVVSKKRNTQLVSATAAGEGLEHRMLDSRELSRPSNVSADGSYSESSHSGPALSTSSIINDSQYLPQPTGTFSKCTILGPKGNITGSFDGTGMRAVGSSEADYSTDSAMIKSHKYERLDDERSLNQAQRFTAVTPAAPSTPKTPKKVTFAETSKAQQAASAPVMTRNGKLISAPKELKIPTTVPKRNSFAVTTLNTAKRLDESQTMKTTPLLFNYDYATESRELHMENVRTLIEMSADDWNRLQSKCMTFPLRVDHLNDMLELDGISTGQRRCYRDNMQPDGRYMESAKCDNCNRWERSHAAVLIRQPFNRARAATQQEIGRKIVFWSTVLPFIGWGFLFAIANRMEASNDLIAGFTKGVIREFGAAEIEAADFYFKCIVGSLFLLFLALLIFTIVIVAQA